MKKITFLFIILFISAPTWACEFCGCSSGNYFIGPLPQFKTSFIGSRYSFRRFDTSVSGDPTQFSKDFYQSIEIWGGVNLGKKWQVLGFLPYAINQQNSDDGVSHTQGLGDLTFIANYNLIKIETENGILHRVWIGGGVKLPLGEYNLDPDNLVASANNQPGSGSMDYLANAMYTFASNNWGVNANLNYKINQSAEGFQFGSRLAASAFVFRSFSTISTTFSPNLGILYEDLNASKQYGVEVEGTGGYTFLGALGLETNLKSLKIGFNVQLPLSQDMSSGQTTTLVRGMMHATYSF